MTRLTLIIFTGFIVWGADVLAAAPLEKPFLSRQWARSTLGKINPGFRNHHQMSPLLTEKHVIQGNGTDGIVVHERDGGSRIWRRNFKNGVEGGAAVSGDDLYFGAGDGKFYCVDLKTGKTKWQYAVNSESLTKPLIVGDKVYHVTGNNTLYAFERTTGQSLWVKTNAAKTTMTVRGQTAPVYEAGKLYLGFSDGTFSSINAVNGRELWSKRIGDDKKFNDVDATAVLSKSCILVASFANALYCLDKNSGSIRWRHDVGGFRAVKVDGERVFYPTGQGEIHILDEASGKELKRIVKIRGLATEVTIFKDFLVYGETEGALVLRDKNSLKKIDEFFTGGGVFASPTVDLETQQIYLMTNFANLFRVDVRTQKVNPFRWSPSWQ